MQCHLPLLDKTANPYNTQNNNNKKKVSIDMNLKPAIALLLAISGLINASTGMAVDVQTGVETAKDVWNNGQTELYIPLHIHHIRSAYDPGKIASFNENPWGMGLGKGLQDGKGGWRGLYAMAFRDSHNDLEPVAGYAYLKELGNAGNFHVNAGFTGFVTAREDIYHYLPIPGILPLASVEFRNASLMTTYLPGRHNNGNIFFIFVKVGLSK